MKTEAISSKVISNIFAISTPDGKDQPQKDGPVVADFESALIATGFGKFNLLLLLIVIPTAWSSMFETTSMSFVFPVAQCDLNLSMEDKGNLNAITYLGMITSALAWGFLADTLGRKRLLVVGYLIDAILVLCSAFSQSYVMLLVFKFLGGFIINGPFAALTTYVSEFHAAKYRARVMMALGIVYSLASIALPLIAWGIFPIHIDLDLFNGYKIHSWNLYLLVCATPSLTGFIAICFMPESPKFLMTIGENEKALRVFRKVYSLNTGKPEESYPIKELVDEINNKEYNPHGGHVTAHRSKTQAIKEGWQQIKPLFFAPYRCHLFLVCLLQMGNLSAVNGLRLWLPQIFIAINDYQVTHNGSTSDLCVMLEMIQPNKTVIDGNIICKVNVSNASVYLNSVIVAVVCIGGYLIAGSLINMMGKKTILLTSALISGATTIGMSFSKNTAAVVALSSVSVATVSIISNVMLAVVVDIFPTTLRTITVAIVMMVGRTGALGGNVLFPLLLQSGCLFPFAGITGTLLLCGLFAMLLPKTDMKALE